MWEHYQLPPAWFDERTPQELLFLFGVKGEIERDPVADLREHNHATGRVPVVPRWLMKQVPRRATPTTTPANHQRTG